MPNLDLSASEATALFEKLGVEIAIISELEDAYRKAKFVRTLIEENNDINNNLESWTLNGININENTDPDALLYVDLKAGTPNTVQIYKASILSSSNLVVSGVLSGVGLLTFTEQNNSGITGTVTLAGAIASNNDIILTVLDDYAKRLADVYTEADENTNGQLTLSQDNLRDTVRSQFSTVMQSRFSFFINTFIDDFLADYMAMSLDERAQGFVNRTYLNALNNRSFDLERGILPYLEKVMDDNTTPITIKKNT